MKVLSPLSVLTRQLRLGLALLVPLGIYLDLAPSARADQYDTMRTYWTNYLISEGGSPQSIVFYGSASSLSTTASNDWKAMDTNATRTYLWSTYTFGSDSYSVTATFQELELMAEAWANPACAIHGNATMGEAITSGMDWMVANIYTPTATEYGDWWDWEMGGPQGLVNAATLMYPDLTATEITNYCSAVDGHLPGGSKNLYGWQNTTAAMDYATVMYVRGVLGKDSGRMTDAQTNTSNSYLYTTSGDGIYSDGSYLMHTSFAYNGGYGVELLSDVAELINLLSNSTWQVSSADQSNVVSWVSNSFEPSIYGGAMMDMMRGRFISRQNESEQTDGTLALYAIGEVAKFAPHAAGTSFSNFVKTPLLPPGQFQFADMDRVVALRTNFGLGISMSSTRIANYESINGENLQGWFTGDGMTYLYLGSGDDAQFTGDFWPTVDDHLPGTTTEQFSHTNTQGEDTVTSQNWVGGAQVAGSYGVAGMSIEPYATSLTGKKSWFMFDDEVVCLGAGITCGGGFEVDSTIEDRRLGTSPTNKFYAEHSTNSPTMGWSTNLPTVYYCALDGVGGYYFPGGGANLEAEFVSNTGEWNDIGSGQSTTTLTDDYLKLWYNFGVKPTNATYAYVILPNMNISQVIAYDGSPDIAIITNTATVQAVRKNALGVEAANFWTGGAHSADLITVTEPSSVITYIKVPDYSVGISDPTHTNTGSITVTLNQGATGTISADPGVTVSQLYPEIILSVNFNGSLGKTFKASFTVTNENPL
jgi:hyaluronate lyase